MPFAAVADARTSVPVQPTHVSVRFWPSRSFLQAFRLRARPFRGDSGGRRDDCAERTAVVAPRQVKPSQDPAKKRHSFPVRRVAARLLHDFDRLRGAPIADVHASGEQSPRTGDQFRHFGVRPAAKRAAHRSKTHNLLHKTKGKHVEDREILRQRKSLVPKIRDCRINDALHRTRVENRCRARANPHAAATHSVTCRRGPSVATAAAVSTVTTFGIHVAAAIGSAPPPSA